MTPHATLPPSLEEPTIGKMIVGQNGYTVPWAMWADTDRRCWLKASFPCLPTMSGTVRMYIERRTDGYHVWPPHDEQHKLSGRNSVGDIPVAAIHQ